VRGAWPGARGAPRRDAALAAPAVPGRDVVAIPLVEVDRGEDDDRLAALLDLRVERRPELVRHERVEEHERLRAVEQRARDVGIRDVEVPFGRVELWMRAGPALQARTDLLDHAFLPGFSRFCGSNARLTAVCSSPRGARRGRARQLRCTKPPRCSREIVPPRRSAMSNSASESWGANASSRSSSPASRNVVCRLPSPACPQDAAGMPM